MLGNDRIDNTMAADAALPEDPLSCAMDERRKILIVDDDELSHAVLENIFFHSFTIIHAFNGAEGMEKAREHRSHLCAIILDVVMPGKGGLEVLQELFKDGIVGDIPVFLVTGETDTGMWEKGYSLGAMDVITKPFVAGIILQRVTSLVELFRSRRRLSQTVVSHENIIHQQQDKIAHMGLGMVEALASVIEFRSGESGEHVRRIRDITSILLSSRLGNAYTQETKKAIAYAAILHDVGKVSIPDAILNKPGRLTPEEFETMKQHSLLGREMLENIPQMKEMPFFRYACDIAAYHHERWDGRGYPFGLKGDEIPLWAQIVSLADVYDALVSVRCYKKSFSHETAADMIQSGQCGAFSPELLEIFLSVKKMIRSLYSGNTGDASL